MDSTNDEPSLKKQKHQDTTKELDRLEALDAFFLDFNQPIVYPGVQYPSQLPEDPSCEDPGDLDEEIKRALFTFNEFSENNPTKFNLKQEETTSSSDDLSPIDSPHSLTSSITSNEDEAYSKPRKEPLPVQTNSLQCKLKDQMTTPRPINPSTIMSIKQNMSNTSKLISTFTTLKTTYLKLCKEFNYLLTKFKDNERIKIELINENNELRLLLMEIIKQKELEKSKYQNLNPISHSQKRKHPSS